MAMHLGQLELTRRDAQRLIGRALARVGLSAAPRIVPLAGAGTTSHVLRVGPDLLARFPLTGEDAGQERASLTAEHAAMEEFARRSPVPAPRPVVIGEGDATYPLPFSVQTWVEGGIATPASVAGSGAFAADLADLIRALRAVDPRGRTFTGEGRGGSLPDHDPWIAECLDRSEGLLPIPELRTLWERLRGLPHESADVMSHTDLIPGNLLVDHQHLVGVLDTGGFAPADPALDLVAAWHLLEDDARDVLRSRLDVPELDWRRGAAWAYVQAIGLVWYYEQTNPVMAALGRSTLRRLLAAGEELRG
ncbi:MAG: phosphotransferase [Brachybacterium sp.]|uniref:phosphotransferase n=1 Tax=Brachybacterium sp. TaxID=1891286 RepID=UPI0026476534|nr:phosphotransferase [Brachybacterium sp.]MDN5686270.1 phosphotransferase [Brachybacterium sp.]